MSDQITCIRCKEPIDHKDDLVVSNMKLILRPFHKTCFKDHIQMKRDRAAMMYDVFPVNGRYGNIMTLIFLVLVVSFILFIEVPIFVYVLCLLYPTYRLFSFLIFERKLPSS